jgi:hypothetical protein
MRALDPESGPLLRTDGRAWPPLLRLWTYSTLSGTLAAGVGQVIVTVTRAILPASPVRLVSMTAVVVGAGLAAEHVLDRLGE